MKSIIVTLCAFTIASCAHHRDPEQPDAEHNSSQSDTNVDPGAYNPEGASTPVAAADADLSRSNPATPSNDNRSNSAVQTGNRNNAFANHQRTSTKAASGDSRRNDAVAPTTPDVEANTPVAEDKTSAATNTKLNERDRSGETLTPVDQSEAPGDLRITQAIRKAVVADGSLSFNAKNVKIITVDGKVTLRGPVATVQERSSVATIARKTAGVISVDDQLEINP